MACNLRAAADAQRAPMDVVDAFIAACTLTRGAAIATRNVRDFAALGLRTFDPWARQD